MNQLRQQHPNTCGQCCVAMIADVPEAEVIQITRRRKTRPRDLRNALQHFGFTLDTLPSFKLPAMPCHGTYLVNIWRIVRHKAVGHWVVWDGGKISDPAEELSDLSDGGIKGAFYKVRKYG